MPKLWVRMSHPDIPSTETEPPEVTAEAYEEVWADMGWTKVDEFEVQSTTSDEPAVADSTQPAEEVN